MEYKAFVLVESPLQMGFLALSEQLLFLKGSPAVKRETNDSPPLKSIHALYVVFVQLHFPRNFYKRNNLTASKWRRVDDDAT